MRVKEIEELWVSEWHPKGDLEVSMLREAVERNAKAAIEHEEHGWVVIGVFLDPEAAREYNRRIKRLRKEWREKHETNTVPPGEQDADETGGHDG